MHDRQGSQLNVGDIVLVVKGLNLSKYKIVKLAVPLQLEEVDLEFRTVKQPRGKKYRSVNAQDCLLAYKLNNNKYIKD